MPAQKATKGSAPKSAKPQQRACETTLKGVEFIEFIPSPKEGEKTPTNPVGSLVESELDYNDDPLVSHPGQPCEHPHRTDDSAGRAKRDHSSPTGLGVHQMPGQTCPGQETGYATQTVLKAHSFLPAGQLCGRGQQHLLPNQ